MARGTDIIRRLREAVRCSPDNAPLRHQLADTLLTYGFFAEAAEEYRVALGLAPKNLEIAVGLAKAFYQQGKHSASLAVIEDLMKNADPPAEAYVLHARLLLLDGQPDRALEQYQLAVQSDPTVADPALAEQLAEVGAAGEDPARASLRLRQADLPEQLDLDLERPRITFRDIGGMELLRDEIRLKIIDPLKHREIFEAYGKSAGGGILMYGPPGCGKTHIARATAGEIQAGFFAVGIDEILDMYLGNSEKNLHEVFVRARRNRPCVLFFDEVDALGSKRSEMRHNAGRAAVNQFLAEMDGVKESNDGVLILAATNAPWYVDSAFRRPGRFDRVIFVPPPDEAAREAILPILLQGKPAKDIDCARVAARTEGFSGADLKAVVDVAVEDKLLEAMKTGVPRPLTTADLLKAVGRRKPTTPEWFATAKNYALYANQGGVYDDIVRYLRL